MINERRARCVAKLSCDGYINEKYGRYNNKCDELRQEFLNDLLKEFGPITITKGMVNSGTKFIQFHDKKTIKYFLTIQSSYKSHNIFIPNILKKSTLAIKKSYLRAVFDDEGSIALRIFRKTNEWKRNITLGSASKVFIEDVRKMLLKDFDIKTNKILKCTKGSKSWYNLSITGKSMINKFKDNIGCRHPKKMKKLDLMLKTYEGTFSRNRKKFLIFKRALETLNL